MIIVGIEPSEKQRAEILGENLAKIRGSYATLLGKLAAKLEQGIVDTRRFCSYVRNLFPPGNIIVDSCTISEIFGILNREGLWDYSSCCIYLEGIVNEFGSGNAEMKEWIGNYKSELAGFKATTKIVDYIKMCDKESEIADSEQSLRQNMARYDKCYCRSITFKLKAHVKEKSLDYIDQFWRSIAEYFLLPSLPALLDSIHSGCVEVTWVLSTPSALQIQENIQAKIQESTPFLQEHGVMRVMMDGEIVCDEKGLNLVSL